MRDCFVTNIRICDLLFHLPDARQHAKQALHIAHLFYFVIDPLGPGELAFERPTRGFLLLPDQ